MLNITEAVIAIIAVNAFVDWNSQLHLNKSKPAGDAIGTASIVLKRTATRIGRLLTSIDQNSFFRVGLRLYHGWHRGYAPTSNRKAITAAISATDFSTLSAYPNISFKEQVGYGDTLLSAMPSRIHPGKSIHLPNTFRTKDGIDIEKMVDTALASDMLYTAFTDPKDWILVVAEDDDHVPAIYTAEAAIAGHQSKIRLVHGLNRSNNFLMLNEISVREK